MTKAFWTSVLILAGLGCVASPALAQGPKQTADKVRNQIERRDRDRALHHDRTDDRDGLREHREQRHDIFVRDEDGRPPGWDRGKKKGWGDCDVPPGQAKKQGCNSFHHESHHTVSRTTSHPVIVRRPRAEAHAQVDAKLH
jgi:hypothetical protein